MLSFWDNVGFQKFWKENSVDTLNKSTELNSRGRTVIGVGGDFLEGG